MKNTQLMADGEAKRNDPSPLFVALFVFASCFLPAHASAATAYLKENAPRLIEKTERAYGGLIDTAALTYETDPHLILAVIVVESEGNPRALSRSGAVGLMQLMPGTAKALGVTNSKEPLQNILAGTRYLKELEEGYAFINSSDEALVAYNMGPTRAKRWLRRYDPEDYPYVANVLYVYGVIKERELAKETEMFRTVRLAGEFAEAVLAAPKPIMVKPRSLSMAEFPMNIPSARRNLVQTKD
ncbi:MAG: hypothetical protein A3C93_04965 [Candidatus Lloydbacteria bacterium RIFCSPHIGHO2_02_FULL_54_17]|uniref:Transglycosylase SLT domain-containing protein n=1 Tax=Candidatus Lloydbacteria bacterium RIFCSPHIGHO2_02_FULL_54_17 TaxID=1798664 RepID=A0A1G2DE40_9BACT|nr:MAG: hypothetical protein A2762_05750 [Candidatus Lloydbacteria bacterium RIFCSPHIGHO2_01_FULL_54_11]OGZ11120.1 MAG: hypothetical protein A3C93_04965 [Candidatus Lloydbacteria bacterium RIFCSPHIGHO2_02_FULL_54_17]OGZ14512.1 MAG: hypothetical protein A2948_05150 [Candidatus Lloydbacteria bacterium RIFCSPLOWO2_01_FULL_54_18]OGZ16944.1 MAG: hypothetical protein A3H76_03380 [Candidatus Lloydbacteria bacterium RIFCSPLOWO2_02_FULL_54_12]